MLGVSRTASAEQIKKVFRKRALQMHPDKVGPGGEAKFMRLSEAYPRRGGAKTVACENVAAEHAVTPDEFAVRR